MGTRYDHGGGAVDTTLSAGITSGDTTASIVSATGWPSGGVNGSFWIAIGVTDAVSGRFTSNVEKILVASRTGTTLSSLARGQDGTTAVAHNTGETVRHIHVAAEAHQSSEHAGNTALDDHTQYLNNTRHDVTARHTFGAALGSPGTPTTIVPDATGAAGSGTVPARSDHTHGIAGAAASTITGANSEGASTSFARADHNHLIGGTNHIPGAALVNASITATQIANDTITATQIAADAITASELANNAVDTAAILDAVVTMAKLASEDSIPWTVNFAGVTLGTGGVQYAEYMKFGRLVVFFCGYQLGTGGNQSGNVQFDLPPHAPKAMSGFTGSDAGRGGIVAARGFYASGTLRQSGIGIMSATQALGFATAGSNATWDANTPWDWTTDSKFQAFGAYVAQA